MSAPKSSALGLGLPMGAGQQTLYPATTLTAFKAARNLTLTTTAHTRAACVGTSVTTGAGGGPSGGNTDAFSGCYGRWVGDAFTDAGYNVNRDSVWGISGLSDAASYALYNPKAVIAAGWIAGGQNSVGGPYWRNSTTTGTFVFTPALNCNKVDLYFPGGGGVTGTISYSIDDETPINVVQSGSERIIKVSRDLTLGPHTVTMRRVSGLTAFIGIDCYDTTIGQIRIWNMGWASTTTAAYSDNALAFSPPNMLTYLDPDLGILAIGINDWSNPLTSAYGSGVGVLGNALTSGGGSLICIGDMNINAGGANRLAYNAVMAGYAAGKAAPYIDMATTFGTYNQAAAAGYMDDGVHPSRLGYRVAYAPPISALMLAP